MEHSYIYCIVYTHTHSLAQKQKRMKETNTRLDLRRTKNICFSSLEWQNQTKILCVRCCGEQARERERAKSSDYECDLIQFINGCIYIFYYTNAQHKSIKKIFIVGAIFFYCNFEIEMGNKNSDSNSSSGSSKKCLARAFFILYLCVCVKRKSLDTRMMNFLVQMTECERSSERAQTNFLFPTLFVVLSTFKNF